MRVGFSLGSLLSVNEIMECTNYISRHDIDSIWIPETWGMESSSVISAVSHIARKQKIGSSIMNIFSRTPALVAMTAATLDTISDGRFILGLGTSSRPIVEDWHGLNFAKPASRTREYLDIVRLILSGKKVDYDGKFFHLKNFRLLITPPREQIPIYIAAINQKMVDLAWEKGDGVIFYLRPLKELRETITRMQRKRKIDVSCQIISCISEEGDKAMERAKRTIAFYVSVGKFYREFLARNGFKREIEAIFEEYQKTGLSNNYSMVSDSMVSELTISGTPNEVNERLRRFVECGVDLPIIQFNPIGDVISSFKLLADTIMSESR